MLTDVAPLIRKISERESLTVEESQFAFDTCTLEDADSYYFLALMLGLHTKGETSDELLGLCRSTERFSPKIDLSNLSIDNITDLSGTGGAAVKTINVSTAASFIVAASGILVAKQSGPVVTGITGSADIPRAFGIELTQTCNTPESLLNSLENVGIVQFFVPYMSQEAKYRAKLYPKLRQLGLTFIMPVHLAAFAFHPMKIKRRIYGMFSKSYLTTLAELFQKLGYVHGLTFYGEPGLCEISNVGITHVVEYTTDSISEYTLSPQDLGVKTARLDDVRAQGKDENILDFLRVLYGIEQGPKRDIVLINAAASLYIMGKAPSIREGVTLAGSIIDSGKAKNKLEDFIRYCGDVSKLDDAKVRAGIA